MGVRIHLTYGLVVMRHGLATAPGLGKGIPRVMVRSVTLRSGGHKSTDAHSLRFGGDGGIVRKPVSVVLQVLVVGRYISILEVAT